MDSPTSYVARSPLDLVALVPIVLGFHPQDSVVLMTFGAGSGPGAPGRSFHARADLPSDPAAQEEVARMLACAVRRHRAPQAAVLLYTDEPAIAAGQCLRLLGRLLDLDCEVLECLRVHGGRFHPLPEDGSAGTGYDLRSHEFTAGHVLGGHVVHPDRAAVAATLLPRSDAAARADVVEVTLAATRVAARLAPGPHGQEGDLGERVRQEAVWLRRRIRRQVASGGDVGPGDAGRLLVLASLGATRDLACAQMSRSSPAHVELWRGLLRRAPHDLRPGAAALLALAAWLRGDGALAWCAVDAAREVEEAHPLAALVAHLLETAESPHTWTPPQIEEPGW